MAQRRSRGRTMAAAVVAEASAAAAESPESDEPEVPPAPAPLARRGRREALADPGAELALIGAARDAGAPGAAALLLVPVDEIEEPASGPLRGHYDPTFVSSIAANIRARGILFPLRVVPRMAEGGEVRYVLTSGGYRLRAAREAGLAEVPVMVVDRPGYDEGERMLDSLSENLWRSDLHPVDRALGFQRAQRVLAEREGQRISGEELARRLGSTTGRWVQYQLKIAALPPQVHAWMRGESLEGLDGPLAGDAPAPHLSDKQIRLLTEAKPPDDDPERTAEWQTELARMMLTEGLTDEGTIRAINRQGKEIGLPPRAALTEVKARADAPPVSEEPDLVEDAAYRTLALREGVDRAESGTLPGMVPPPRAPAPGESREGRSVRSAPAGPQVISAPVGVDNVVDTVGVYLVEQLQAVADRLERLQVPTSYGNRVNFRDALLRASAALERLRAQLGAAEDDVAPRRSGEPEESQEALVEAG